jgi:hypothetical protein
MSKEELLQPDIAGMHQGCGYSRPGKKRFLGQDDSIKKNGVHAVVHETPIIL